MNFWPRKDFGNWDEVGEVSEQEMHEILWKLEWGTWRVAWGFSQGPTWTKRKFTKRWDLVTQGKSSSNCDSGRIGKHRCLGLPWRQLIAARGLGKPEPYSEPQASFQHPARKGRRSACCGRWDIKLLWQYNTYYKNVKDIILIVRYFPRVLITNTLIQNQSPW